MSDFSKSKNFQFIHFNAFLIFYDKMSVTYFELSRIYLYKRYHYLIKNDKKYK